MASVYDLKPRFQARLRPLCAACARAGVTANQVTLAALGLSLAWGGLLVWRPRPALLGLPLVLLARMALNAIDGMLAREHGQASARGALLNELGDLLSDAALYLPFALLPGISPALVVGVVLAAWLTEIAGILGATIGASRRYDGPLGKSDRALAFAALGPAMALMPARTTLWNALFALLLALSLLTALRRGRAALAEAAASPETDAGGAP